MTQPRPTRMLFHLRIGSTPIRTMDSEEEKQPNLSMSALHPSEQDLCTTTAMQRTAREKALNTLDVISTIFTHLEQSVLECGTESSYQELVANRKTLYSLALTIKLFLRPALDILWRNLDSMVPLLKLLPFIHIERTSSGLELSLKPTHAYSTTLNDSSWDKFHSYASRVRAMRIHPQSNKGYKIIQETYIYMTLSSLRQNSSCFPNLQTLVIEYLPVSTSGSGSNELSVQLPLLLLSPALHMFEIPATLLQSINNGNAFLAMLTLKAPHLRQFRLTQCNESNNPFSDYSSTQFILTIQHLHIFGVNINLDPTLLLVVGRQMNLTSLTLSNCGQMTTTAEKSHANWKLFPNSQMRKPIFQYLESLEVGGSLDMVHDFLDYVSSTRLQKVVYNIILPKQASFASLMQTKTTGRGRFIDFINDIMDRWGDTLQEFEIKFSGGTGYDNVQAVELGELLFQPLNKKKYLRSIRYVNFPGRLSGVTDHAYLKDVLPTLESLYLPTQETGLGIVEFRKFISSVPNLKDLAISLDLTAPIHASYLRAEFLDHKLNSLTVLSNCPVDTFNAACQLDDIFPHLVELKGTGNGWDAVQNMLRLCQYGRRRTH